jgi:hypothetical protein
MGLVKLLKVANGRFDPFPKPAPPGRRCSGDQRETEWYNTQIPVVAVPRNHSMCSRDCPRKSDLETEAIGQLEEFLSSRVPRAPTALFGRAVA